MKLIVNGVKVERLQISGPESGIGGPVVISMPGTLIELHDVPPDEAKRAVAALREFISPPAPPIK